MRCPTCGHTNNDLATRCSACGSPLPTGASASGVDATDKPTASPPTSEGTAERPHVQVDSPHPESDARPRLRRTGNAIGSAVSKRAKLAGSFFHRHERALGAGIAIGVVVVMGVLWFVLNLANAPTYAQIEDDMRTLLPTFPYTGGTYGPDLDIPLASVSVTKRERTQTPQGLETSTKGGAYRIEAESVYDDGTMHVVRDVGATYVRTDGSWSMAGELDELGTSYTARSGVDKDKVLANMDSILEAAGDTGGEPLSTAYADGTFAIEGDSFVESPEKDTANDDVVIRCSRETGFYAYGGTVTARFAFESGEWQLRTVEADAQTTRRDYGPLVGTWTGDLVDHEAVKGSCYGAEGHPLAVTIDSVEDSSQGGGQVQGTLSGIAHFHKRLERDQSSNEGDVQLESAAFTGVISTAYDAETGSSLNVACTTVGIPQGEVSLTLSFGTDEDPSTVLARVTTTYQYEEMVFLILPHQTTAYFTDTYLLTRAG